jgi:hypothetical protein
MQEQFAKAVRTIDYEIQYILIDIAYVVGTTIVITVKEIVKAILQ